MADEEAKLLKEAKALPLRERIGHKNWKVRSEAYDDVKAGCERAFASSDPIFEEAGPVLAMAVGDANANAMDRALEALCAWLQKADEVQAGRIVSPVCNTMAAKCLKARPGTVAKATEAFLLFIELEQQEAAIEATLKALADKVPKVVLAALEVLLRAVSDFGPRALDPKPLFKSLPAVFAHPNAGVRDKCKEICVELALGLGTPVVQGVLMEKMSDAMKKDVESGIAAAQKKPPSRFTRKEAAAREAAGGGDDGAEGGEGDGAAPMEVDNDGRAADAVAAGADPYEFADPADIMGPLGKSSVVVGDDSVPFWECFESKKWNVRKGALDKVREAARAPRLAPGDYGELCRELKKVLAKDANINCAAAAAEVVGALALGLRRDFHSNARQLCSPVMERFKEKNTTMSRAADEALRALATHCYSLGDVAEDLATAMAHKNPKVRLDTLRLLRDMVDATDRKEAAKIKEALVGGAAKLAPDADAGIREAAQSVLVAFALKLGSFSAVQPFISKLDDTRTKIIEEAVMAAAKQQQAGGAKPKAAAAAKAAAAPAAVARAPSGRVGSAASSARSSPKALAPKNANVAGAAARAAAKPAAAARPKTAAAAPARSAEDDAAPITSGRLSPEEAEAKLVAAVGEEAVANLRAVKWQDRLESVTAIAEHATQKCASPDASALLLCLAHLPGWSDKNFQVVNKVLEVAAALARGCPGFGRVHAAVAVEGAGDKLHELKHRIPATEALTAAAEAVGPRFVAAQLHARAAANKNPKVLSESLAWLATAVDEFGLVSLDLAALLQWVVADLGSPNAPVRNQAMAVLGRCHAQVGGGLMAQLAEGLKPAQLTALEEIFRKNPQDPAYKPQRTAKKQQGGGGGGFNGGENGGAALGGGEEEEEEAAPASLDDLLPRANVSSQLPPTLIAQISSANWKERNAALEEVENVLKAAGGRIAPELPAELFPALRGRMADTNRNLAARTLLLLGKLAEAVGAPFDKLARPVLIPALATLTDNKKQVRDAAVAMLDAWLSTCTEDKLFPPVSDVVVNPKINVDGRAAALGWMAKAMAEGKAGVKCTDCALKAAAAGLGDKSPAVRDGAGQLLSETAAAVGSDELLKALGGLNPAARKTAEPWVMRTIAAAGASAAAAAAAAAPAKTAAAATAAAPSKTPGHSSSRAASAAASMASLTVAVSEQDAPALLSMSSAKAARSRLFRPRPGKFDAPAPDEVESLDAAFAGVASDEFRALLFSRDFKDHVKAADALEGALPLLLPEVTASLDLVLRWSVVRVCDGNMQVLVRVLEMLRAVLRELESSEYRLTDVEAAALVPAVADRAGHNQDRVRALHRDVLRGVCRVYPAHRVADYLVAALGAKNSRTRVECCAAMAEMVDSEGVGVLTASKAKPMAAVAAMLKERDGALRGAALGVVEAVYLSGGADTLWKMLGRLDGREKDMVEDRLRRAAARQPAAAPAEDEYAEEDAQAEDPPVAATPPYNDSKPTADEQQWGYRGGQGAEAAGAADLEYSRPAFTPPNALDITPVAAGRAAALAADTAPDGTPGYYPAPAGASAVLTPVPRAFNSPSAAPEPAAEAEPSPRRYIPATSPLDGQFQAQWEENLAGMASPSLPDAINATKALCSDVMAVADPNKQPPASQRIRAVMGASAERLFSAVLTQLEAIFADAARVSAVGETPSSRGCKFALNVMLQGLGVEEVAAGLPQGTLRRAISLLLCRLVDERGLLVFDDGTTLVRAVNVLVAKMLEAANRNYCFAALLLLLRDPPAGVPAEAVPKFNDLVVKCLIKLTKGLQGGLQGVELGRLLLDVHDFFMYLGVDEIRRRSSADDKPLRMVKTVLHELCKMAGHGIYDHTASIVPGRFSSPQPIIFAYIALNLASLEQNGTIQAITEAERQERDLSAMQQHEAAMKAARAAASVSSLSAASGGGGGSGMTAAEESSADLQAAAVKAEVKQRLKDVMTRLVQRDPGMQRAAMVELHRLRREHPAYVERYVAGTSEMFRQFIDDGLARLDKEGYPAAGVGAAAVPQTQATPPAAAQQTPGASSKLSSLRERLSSIKASADGQAKQRSRSVSGERAPAAEPRAAGGASNGAGAAPAAHPSVEELTARLQMLRRGQS